MQDEKRDSEKRRHGKFVFANGDVYEGEYEANSAGSIERTGFGTLTCSEGVVYSGNWRADKMNGKGSFYHPAGMKYEGDFVDGKFEGIGRYVWPDGFYYEGEFRASKLEGRGFFRDPNGQIWLGKFEGDFANRLQFKLNM